MKTRADLHVHSKCSDRPSEWFLRRVGAPECFTEPLEVYRRAKARGMDFVTVADHNCIAGALEIAHLPDTFLANEVTTYFPEDGCKIHCLVVGISEAQFRVIQDIRANIYELQQYLADEEITCSITHPLFRVNDRLTVDHLEKLLLLFKRFELINGTRDRHSAAMLQSIFAHLTQEHIEAMADRHGIVPWGPEPWKKWVTGGSDDHSGVHIASAYTATPAAKTVEEFLAHLKAGRHQAEGSSGGSLLLAHSLSQIAYSYYKDRFLPARNGKTNVLGEMLGHLLECSERQGTRGWRRFLPGFAYNYVRARRLRRLTEVERLLVEEVSHFLGNEESFSSSPLADRRAFETTCRIAHLIGYSLLGKFVAHMRDGRVLESLQTASALAPVLLGVAPYLAAFSTQHKDDAFLRSVSERFPAARKIIDGDQRKAWITDTFGEVNGVCRTIECMANAAKNTGRNLTVLTCLDGTPKAAVDLKNFQPVGTFSIPDYELQKLAFPPFLEVIEFIESQRFGEVILSTPGPLGLTGLAAARLLGLRKTGIYHTDFPLIVRHVTLDHAMEELTWKYILWFYSQMDTVLVPSECYRRHLVRHGLEPGKIVVMGHGVDTEEFHPRHGDNHFWERYGLKRGFTFLYAGRVSPDKNLEELLVAFRSILKRIPDANLAVVGDGPLLSTIKDRYRDPRIVFTGFLRGEELARAYASADAFVFPSTTDTFGLAVLEAQASGLPAIVSDCGGPAETVSRNGSGLIVDLGHPRALADAMEKIARDQTLHARLREAALRTAAENTWDRAVDRLWLRHPAGNEDRETVLSVLGYSEPTTGLIAMEVP